MVMSGKITDPYVTKRSDEARPATGSLAASPASEIPTTEPLKLLANKVMDWYRVNRDHRRNSGIDDMLADAGLSDSLKYTQEQEDKLHAAGLNPKDYPPLTAMKNRSMCALLTDIVKNGGDKPYTMAPTPKPSIPESVRKRILEEIASEIESYYSNNLGAPQTPEEEEQLHIAILLRVSEMYDEARRREMEWARERCDRMDQKIHDQLVEGSFNEAFAEMIGNLCVYGTACMIVGPRVDATCGCREIDGYEGAVKYVMSYVERLSFEAVSPWDCYPAPGAKKPDQGPMCFKVRYTANALWRYSDAVNAKGSEANASLRHEGWQSDTVGALLSRYPNGGCRLEQDPHDMVRCEISNDALHGDADDCMLEGVRCFAPIRGSDLIKWGFYKLQDGERVIHYKYYRTETIVIGGYVVYCRIIDERLPFPIVKATIYGSVDSWWGKTIAKLCRVPQQMQNNALKNMTLNSSVSSLGIYVCSDVNNVVSLDGSPALALRGGKVLGFNTPIGQSSNPFSSVPVLDTTQSQIRIIEEASKLADDYSGIPQYTVGSSTQLGSGAGRTASGLSMMEAAATRVVAMCVRCLGIDVIVPLVKFVNVWNLLYDEDVSVKGDVDINPSGLIGKVLREAEAQRRQQVSAQVGQHPVYSQAITVEGFFELLRPDLEGIGVNPDKIIPSKERMAVYQRILDAARAQQAAQAMMAGQGAEAQQNAAAPSPEQANLARVQGNPEAVAMQQGVMAQEARAGTVAERRNAA